MAAALLGQRARAAAALALHTVHTGPLSESGASARLLRLAGLDRRGGDRQPRAVLVYSGRRAATRDIPPVAGANMHLDARGLVRQPCAVRRRLESGEQILPDSRGCGGEPSERCTVESSLLDESPSSSSNGRQPADSPPADQTESRGSRCRSSKLLPLSFVSRQVESVFSGRSPVRRAVNPGLHSYQANMLRRWLPLCILVLRLLVFDAHSLQVGGKQPILGASLSWAVTRGFRRAVQEEDRTVTFTLHSAVRMAKSCNYTVSQKINCSLPSTAEQTCSDSDDVCQRATDTEMLHARAVMAEHGVLCVGQVVRAPDGALELIYVPSEAGNGPDDDSCASDSSRVVGMRLNNGTYSSSPTSRSHARRVGHIANNRLGKANNFLVTSLHYKDETLSAERRIQGMDVALGVLVHTVHVDKEAVGLIAWLSSGVGAGPRGGDILLPSCDDSARLEEQGPCSTNTNVTAASGEARAFASPAQAGYWHGLAVAPPVARGVSDALIKTYVPLCCHGPDCITAQRQEGFGEPAPLPNALPLNLSCAAFLGEESSFNHNSPVPAFPLLVQVAVVPNASLLLTGQAPEGASFYRGSAAGSLDPAPAPHPPMYYRAYDPDGHMMTNMFPAAHSGGNVRCFLASIDGVVPAPHKWPSRLCLRPGASSEGALACGTTNECRSTGDLGGGSETDVACEEPWSGCRDVHDSSSEGLSANIIKFDFPFSVDEGRARFSQVRIHA